MTTTTKKQKRYSKKIPIHQRPGPFNWVTGGQQQVDSCCDLHSVLLLLLLVPLLYHLLFSLKFRFVAPHYSPPPVHPIPSCAGHFCVRKVKDSSPAVFYRVLPSFFKNILHPGWPRLRRTTITDVFIFHPLGSFDLFYLFRIVSRFVFSHIFSENLKKNKVFLVMRWASNFPTFPRGAPRFSFNFCCVFRFFFQINRTEISKNSVIDYLVFLLFPRTVHLLSVFFIFGFLDDIFQFWTEWTKKIFPFSGEVEGGAMEGGGGKERKNNWEKKWETPLRFLTHFQAHALKKKDGSFDFHRILRNFHARFVDCRGYRGVLISGQQKLGKTKIETKPETVGWN